MSVSKKDYNLRNLWENVHINPVFSPGYQEKKRARAREPIWQNNDWKPHSPGERKRHASPESTERSEEKWNSLRHIVIKVVKGKEEEWILKAGRPWQLVTYKGASVRLSSDFLTESFQARCDWQNIFKVIKGKYLQTRLVSPAGLSLKIEGEMNVKGKIISNAVIVRDFNIPLTLMNRYFSQKINK